MKEKLSQRHVKRENRKEEGSKPYEKEKENVCLFSEGSCLSSPLQCPIPKRYAIILL